MRAIAKRRIRHDEGICREQERDGPYIKKKISFFGGMHDNRARDFKNGFWGKDRDRQVHCMARGGEEREGDARVHMPARWSKFVGFGLFVWMCVWCVWWGVCLCGL